MAYTHVSDQFGPFVTQNTPANAGETIAIARKGKGVAGRIGRHHRQLCEIANAREAVAA